MSADAIVIGAGQNGLAAAVHLAGSGRRVLVVERRERVGGLCAAEEFTPGYTVPGVLHDGGLVDPEITARLGLEQHGLRFREAPPVLAAEPGGPGLLLARDGVAAPAELAARSPQDAAAYAAWRGFLDRVAPAVRSLLRQAPPPLDAPSLADAFRLARRGWPFLRLGRADLTELARVLPMCVADWLNESFETSRLVELLAARAVAATYAGPWSPGTAAGLLLHECASGGLLDGGPPALIRSLEAAARSLGAELRAGLAGARNRRAPGRVAGVTLASGEEVAAPVVLSTCDPKQTVLRLLSPVDLPVRLERQFRGVRCRGTAAKVHLALAGPLEFPGREGASIESVSIGGGHVDALERAFDAVKYRRFSEEPHLEVRIPSVSTPELAPPGHHVASILASFAPYPLDGGWTMAQRQAFGEAVLRALERCSPGACQRIVAWEVLTPPDLEERYGLTGGQLHHGEPALDQLFVLRPTAAAARYATPIGGLFLGGSGSHPGGGVTCTPGVLAAEAVLGRMD